MITRVLEGAFHPCPRSRGCYCWNSLPSFSCDCRVFPGERWELEGGSLCIPDAPFWSKREKWGRQSGPSPSLGQTNPVPVSLPWTLPKQGMIFPSFWAENRSLEEPKGRQLISSGLTPKYLEPPAIFCWNSPGRKPGRGTGARPSSSLLPPWPIPFAVLSAHFLVLAAITLIVSDSFPKCFLSWQNLELLVLGALQRRALWNSMR